MPLSVPARALLIGTVLCMTHTASAQTVPPPLRFPPILKVPEAEQPIRVASLNIGVVIHGLHAETTQTVTFFNPNGRVLEGNLEFPLPDGATVNGFGLDVGGQLVDGVVVQKDRARVILETEIRKGIDPGLVEQVRGNVYRTRLYPLPAHGTRTVRLSWVSELTTRGTDAAYHLPLPYDAPIGEVTLRVEVVRAPVTPAISGGFGNVTLSRWEDRWVAESKWADAAPAADLLVRLPALPSELIDLEQGDGETFFSVSETVPEGAPAAPQPPRRVAIAWDSSGSRTPEATDRELAFLQQLLAAWSQTAVDLVVFRNKPENPVSFPAGDRGKKLLAALRGQAVDGGTAFAALDLTRHATPNRDDDLWLVFTDGLGTLGEALPRSGGVPVWTITGSSQADRPLLRALSQSNGAELIDLLGNDTARAVAAVTHPGPTLLGVIATPSDAIADLQIVHRADRTRVAILGRLLAAKVELSFSFGAGPHPMERQTVKLRREEAAARGEGPGPVATAWGQARAEQLSLFAEKNADELLKLGRRFGLVTANTSLLVLETLAQHLQYGIEPPASRPELHRDYLAQAGQQEQAKHAEEKSHLEEVVALWNARVAWWDTDFKVPPGFVFREGGGKGSSRGALHALNAEPMADMAEVNGMASAPPAPPSGAESLMRSESAPMQALAAAKSDAASEAGNEAAIAIKPWDPEVPYLVPMRQATRGAAYAAYLSERGQYASPAFFLDAGGFLIARGEKELGLRVLSNLAELRLDDPPLLRVLAWRLSEAGELSLAAGILEKVLRLRPEEPQSRRDLALVLADRAETALAQPNDAQRSVDLLLEVIDQRWDRFPEIELIALMEVNRILARAQRRGDRVDASHLDKRLRKLLDVDLRVSLAWDADLTDVDLHVFEPTEEHAFYGHNRTTIGGIVSRDFTQGYGPEEYLVRRALPGKYAVKAHYYGSRQQTLVGPATLTATVFTHWGRADEKREVLTLRLDAVREMEDIGEVTIGGRGGHAAAAPGRTIKAFRGVRRGMPVEQVTALAGEPDEMSGGEETVLRYRLDDGSGVRVKLRDESGVISVVQSGNGAEVELLP